MKNLKFLVFLSLFGLVFGGGDTRCGAIEISFAELFQVSEDMIDRLLNFTIATVESYPMMGNSYIKAYNCKAKVISNILATGTSQITGVDADYILKILNGTVNPPFVNPLDCIDDALLSLISLMLNISSTIIPELESKVVASPVNSSSSCEFIVNVTSPYVSASSELSKSRFNRTIADATEFTSIGKKDLYMQFYDSIAACENQTFTDIVLEVFNLNETELAAFMANTSGPAPYVLGCTLNATDYDVNKVNSINSSIVAQNCEPFYSQFMAFSNVWFTYLQDLQNITSRISSTHPTLVRGFIADFLCELESLILMSADAINSLSGVDSETVYNILTEVSAPPYPAPLDCVTNQINSMRNKISLSKTLFVDGLRNLAQNASSNTATCASTYQALSGYVSIYVEWQNIKASMIHNSAHSFGTVNMTDIFLDSFAAVISCSPRIIGEYVGAALNINGAPVTAYLAGNKMTLPYPFSCGRLIIGMLDDLMSNALVNIILDVFEPLVVPVIPAYRG